MTKQTLFLFLLGSFINQTFSQGFGIGEPSATSTLQVRGKGNTAATSALHVTDKDSISLFFIRDDGNIGVGTTSPIENFHILGQNFAVTGVLGSGDALSLSGAGTRMFFYPQKGAFRAGTVTANQWNNGSIGNYSVAMGQNTTASGAASTALGTGTSATNSYATALGANTEASGIYSTAMGYNTVANGQNATAIGTATTASGQYAISIGNGTIASGIATTAMGQSTIASAYRETAIGSYNTIATGFSPSAWVETDRLFTIGNGAAAGAESNALVMLKNGNTTLKGALTLTDGTSFFTLPKVDGTVGQGLVTDGNGNVSWGSPTVASPYTAGTGIAIASGVISNTGDLSATNELELPTQTGNTGKYLTTDGTNVSWSSVVGSGTSLNGAYNEGGAGAGRTITANNGAVLVNGTDGLQITGASGSGATLTLSGVGTRMFFYPKKAAFRAGEVTLNQWDDANIGDYSTAMGRSTKASGGGSTAIGYATTASGWASTTLGYFTNAIGAYSTAMGFSSAANGHHSMAMGLQSTSNAWGSFSLGNKATANGSYSIALGDSTKTSGISSTAMGKGTNAIAYGETAMGLFNTIASSSNSIAFVATDRLFTIGNGTDPSNQSDALVMLKNGNTTLKGALTLTNGTSSFTLPQTDGTAGQVLTTDGSGVVSWGTAAGGGGSLNTAYNFGGAGAGRIITADSGAILIQGVDGFQVTGIHANGKALDLAGAGTRMFFYPKKGAFRAGNINGTQWNDSLVGYHSMATGMNTKANGNFSTAMGVSTTASGDGATSMGDHATAMGTVSIATGLFTTASGNSSTAMGSNTTASGDGTTAMGIVTNASALAETAIGLFSTNASSSDGTTWIGTDRLFTIGNGTDVSNKSDALVMLKNGNTTLKGALTLTNGTSSYTLPQVDGTSGQILTTDGSGVVTWISPSSGSGGSGSGGGTLGGSYNYGGAGVGRTITADNGAVLVQGTDGLQVTGTFGSGAALALSGVGTRMFFYPQKAAFRAGYVDSTEWNDTNIGNYSTAMGYHAISSAYYSTAMGKNTTASGIASVAMGYGTTANGYNSTAMGYSTTASGTYATTMGAFTTASGTYALATGYNTTATGHFATAIGTAVNAPSIKETALGAYNTDAVSPNPNAWILTDRLFTIGNGTGPNNKSNALVMLKNGNTTLKGALTLTNGTSSYTLPQTDGAAGQVLITDGSGILSWTSVSGVGNTLNGAYNNGGAGAGRIITADNGAVLINGTDGFQVTGNGSSGAALALSGAGTRMFFYPQKAAFRAGNVTGTQWDDANIDYASVAMGENTIANGMAATAMGGYTIAHGSYSTAMGISSIANGMASVAIGYNAKTYNDNCIAIGKDITTTGQYALAMGYEVNTSGMFSTAMGAEITAMGDYSVAMGDSITADGRASVVIGKGLIGQSYGETVLGTHNTTAASYDQYFWATTDRLFTIGNGTGPNNKSNALVMLKNGNTTLKGALTLTNGTSSYTLPQTDGTAGQVLTTDGSGVVTWTSPSGGSGGSGGGGGTLDGSYDYGGAGVGRTITADNGAVLVQGTDGLQVTGSLGSGTSLALSGAGTKMFFYPKKAAFRAGNVGASEWDEANIGTSSTAMGRFTKASGYASTALGDSSIASGSLSTAAGFRATASGSISVAMGEEVIASGDYSVAMGTATNATGIASLALGGQTTASGFVSTAMGRYTTASAQYTTAMGIGTTASGNYATAMGQNTIASGTTSTATGYQTTASGVLSTAIGSYSTASGDYSTAMGQAAISSGQLSTAMGHYTVASGKSATAMGEATKAESFAETSIGMYSTSAVSPSVDNWVATDRLFTIGNGTGSGAFSDALVMLKNGNTTLKGALTLTNGASSFTLPQVDGTAGQVLTTNGSGIVSWGAAAGGGGSLNAAYNFSGAGAGRVITADDGAVVIQGSDGFQVTGTFGSGDTLSLAGTGAKMFFNPKKAAFRAGEVNAAHWNNANIGDNSTATGYNTTASGAGATAMGGFTTATTYCSVAMGNYTTASGYISTAIGSATTASGNRSTAMGSYTTASGFGSLSTGGATTASADYATATGYTTNASGIASLATGSFTVASANYSTSMGRNTTASAFGETVVGLYNTIDASANATAWASADRVFTVGNGSSANTLSNAFTVYKSGEALHGGSVMVAGDVTALTFNTLSDKRYKKNILPITSVAKQGSVLASLDAINGYYYDFRVNEFPEKKFTDAKQIGFIAQELEKVYPELVTTDAKGYKSVDYAKMTPVLLEAIKELKAQNAKIVDDFAKLQVQNAKIVDDFAKLQVQNAKIADDNAKLQVQNAKIADDNAKLQVQNGKIADDNAKLQVQNGKIEAKIEALENAVYGNVKR